MKYRLLRCIYVMAFGLLPFTTVAQTQNQEWSVDVSNRWQTHEGWGVSLCWWANMCGRWDDKNVEELVDWLVSPEGLNYNIFRYNIGGGEDPENRHCTPHHMAHGKGVRAEMEGFQDELGGEYHWERDEAQRRIMLMIKKKRPDAIFEAFSNSAPWWMTFSGCVGGNTIATVDNLNPVYYKAFAQYLVDVCKHYKEAYGIEFRTLEPFNEPVTDYWYANGSQEGCHFGARAQTEFVKVLYPILKESGLKTVISASDETNVETSVNSLKTYLDEGVLQFIGQWNTHTYGGSIEAKKELQRLTSKFGVRFWQSETGDGGHGIHGNLRMAQRLIDDVRYLKPSAWVDWQYVEENGDQWSLVTTDSQWHQYTRHHNFYVRKQFSHFIPAGYTFVECGSKQALAAVSPNGKRLVLVVLNTSGETVNHKVELPHVEKATCYRTSEYENTLQTKEFTLSDKQLQFQLPPLSIATFVCKL